MGQVFANHTSEEGLISGIYKELLHLKQKDNQSISKWENNLNRHFSREDIQRAHKPMK